jgi:hypothetical protein
MAKEIYPKAIFVTYETGSEMDPYHIVHRTAIDALEDTDGDTVAEYALVKVRKGKLVPEWQS